MEPIREQFYLLSLPIYNGKHKHYLCNNLTEVRNILMLELTIRVESVIFDDKHMLLHLYQRNKKSTLQIFRNKEELVSIIELRKIITLYIGNFAPIKFDDAKKIVGYYDDRYDIMSCLKFNEGIDFDSRKLSEVRRYLDGYKKVCDIGRGQIPPTVGVQIDFTSVPRAENPTNFSNGYRLNFGDFEGVYKDIIL